MEHSIVNFYTARVSSEETHANLSGNVSGSYEIGAFSQTFMVSY